MPWHQGGLRRAIHYMYHLVLNSSIHCPTTFQHHSAAPGRVLEAVHYSIHCPASTTFHLYGARGPTLDSGRGNRAAPEVLSIVLTHLNDGGTTREGEAALRPTPLVGLADAIHPEATNLDQTSGRPLGELLRLVGLSQNVRANRAQHGSLK